MRNIVLLGSLFMTFFAQATSANEQIRISAYHGPETLNTAIANTSWDTSVHINMFDGLVVRGPKSELLPGLAESWTVSNANHDYIFNIRPGIRWSDGEPINAHSIAESFRKMLAADIKNVEPLRQLVRVDETISEGAERYAPGILSNDKNQLIIHLQKPVSYLLDFFADTSYAPLPIHAINDDLLEMSPVTANYPFSGPYMITEVQENGFIATKNPYHYAQDTIAIDEIKYTWQDGSDEAIYRMIAVGEIDLGIVRSSQQTEFIRSALKDYLLEIKPLSIDYLALNTTKAPFDSVDMRRAMSMAVDRETLSRLANSSEVKTTDFLLPVDVNNYPGDVHSPWYDTPYNERLKLARTIMKAHGYTAQNPLKLEMAINKSTLHERVATALRSMWKRIGADVNVTVRNVADHYKEVRAGNFNLARVGWAADFDDPQNFLFLFHTDARSNYARWSNPQYDNLLSLAQTKSDREDIKAIQREALALAQDQASRIPLYIQYDFQLVSPELNGVYSNPFLEFSVRWMWFGEKPNL